MERVYKAKESCVSRLFKIVIIALFYASYIAYYFNQEEEGLQIMTYSWLAITGVFCLIVNYCIFTRVGKCLGFTRGG